MNAWSMRVSPLARRVAVMSCAGVVALLGGCGGASTSSSSSTTAAEPEVGASTSAGATQPAVKPTCAAVSPALIKQTLNLDVSAPTQVAEDTSVECTYPSGVGNHSVIVRFETEQGIVSFADRRRSSDADGQPTSDVSGVGDEAYSSSVEFGDTVTNTLVARKGSVEVRVVTVASIEAEKALLTTLLSTLSLS